jgi:hypothetical protein
MYPATISFVVPYIEAPAHSTGRVRAMSGSRHCAEGYGSRRAGRADAILESAYGNFRPRPAPAGHRHPALDGRGVCTGSKGQSRMPLQCVEGQRRHRPHCHQDLHGPPVARAVLRSSSLRANRPPIPWLVWRDGATPDGLREGGYKSRAAAISTLGSGSAASISPRSRSLVWGSSWL